MVDRVELHRVHGTQRLRCWRNEGAAYWQEAHVTFGRLAGGRWWADRTGQQGIAEDGPGAFVFDAGDLGCTLALRLAYRWMSDGQQWRATPTNEPPDDGLPWVRRGGQWVLEGQDAPGPAHRGHEQKGPARVQGVTN